MGLARLMRLAYAGADIAPLGIKLIERIGADPGDANALMDLATLMYLDFAPELATDFQRQALAQQRHYRLAAATERLRLLVLMAPGNLMANAPLEFLVEESDISLEMLYIAPGESLPAPLPEHDLLWVAINECDAVQPLLLRLAADLEAWPRPVINRPARIADLARDRAGDRLKGIPGLIAPRTVRIDGAGLRCIGRGELHAKAVDRDLAFPLIVRPVGSHAGQGLARLDDPSAIADYLQSRGEHEHYLTRYVDYRGGDGLFRKYRIALIDGRPYACHMAVSDRWMVHYLNAGMADSAEKRAEEARFMAGFERDFARRHAAALQEIYRRAELDYLIIDCAETPQGELLVFEIDSGAVIHDLDPAEVFPYKRPQMARVFAAFREMVFRRAQRRRGQS
jgi:glutathione synthase/RimK-type ligase-like ATP-grasp enzyme